MELTIKFNNTCSRVICNNCGCDLWPAVGHQIVLKQPSYYFVCEECVEHSPFGPLLIEQRNKLNEDYEMDEVLNWINEG